MTGIGPVVMSLVPIIQQGGLYHWGLWRAVAQPSAIRIGGELFSHNVHGNPQCDAMAGDTVLAAQIGSSFYVICREV